MMPESAVQWSKAQYKFGDYTRTLRIKRSKLFPDGKLRDPERARWTLERFLVRCAQRHKLIPAVGRFDMRVLEPCSDHPRVSGALGCWAGVRPEHVEMMRRTQFPRDQWVVEVMFQDEYAPARAAVDACSFRAMNYAEGEAVLGKPCPGCGYLIANIFCGDPDFPVSLGHDMRQYLGGVT